MQKAVKPLVLMLHTLITLIPLTVALLGVVMALPVAMPTVWVVVVPVVIQVMVQMVFKNHNLWHKLPGVRHPEEAVLILKYRSQIMTLNMANIMITIDTILVQGVEV